MSWIIGHIVEGWSHVSTSRVASVYTVHIDIRRRHLGEGCIIRVLPVFMRLLGLYLGSRDEIWVNLIRIPSCSRILDWLLIVTCFPHHIRLSVLIC
jgi:hypothetical protein